MKNVFLITCAILGCSFVIKAQHCPFDGANLIVIHLTDLDERPIKNAKISLQEIDNPNAESCSYSTGLLNKEFKPTESVLDSLYKMNNIAEKYCPDCSFLGEGFYAVSLNQAEETCMVKNGNDFKYQKRKFEIRYGDKKQIVEKEDIHSLCLSVGKWSRIKPIELAAKIDGIATKVPILQQQKPLGQFHFRCYPLENRIVDKDLFEKIKEKKECSDMDSLKIDFSKQTLIFYRVGGDCHMKVTTDVFRNDEAKTYTVQINNRWGGCRAGGSFKRWLVIEKIPTDYKIDFKEILIDGILEYEKDKLFSVGESKNPNAPSPESIESSEADLRDCIQMYQQNRFVIKTKETYSFGTIEKRKRGHDLRCRFEVITGRTDSSFPTIKKCPY